MVVLNKEALEFIKLFAAMTKAEVKHCFLEGPMITFIVEKHQAGKAVGKNGINIKRFSKLFRKSIKVIEFNEDKIIFLRNILFPLIPKDILAENNKITIVAEDKMQKGRIFGRDKLNFKRIKEIFDNNFKGFEIVIV